MEILGVAGDDAAIEADVDPALAVRGTQLLLEVGDGGGGGDGIQRHVDDGGDAAKGRGLGAGIEALPLGAAGLIEVNVRIDEAGEQDMGGIVGVGGPGRELLGGDDRVENGGDLPGGAREDDGGRRQTTGDDGAGRSDDRDGGGRGLHGEESGERRRRREML